MKTEYIDKTIETLCEWVQEETQKTGAVQGGSILPDMVKALAELITARACVSTTVEIDAKAVSEAVSDRCWEILKQERCKNGKR